MKTIFMKRALLGIPLGISTGYIISIIFSVCFTDGNYGAVRPELAIAFGSELNAVVVQIILWGLIGFLYSGFSVVWEKDDWSLFKQTLVVFLVYLLPILIIGYILKWFAFSILQVVIFILIFMVIFAMIWIVIYLKTKKDVNALNSKIKKQ